MWRDDTRIYRGHDVTEFLRQPGMIVRKPPPFFFEKKPVKAQRLFLQRAEASRSTTRRSHGLGAWPRSGRTGNADSTDRCGARRRGIVFLMPQPVQSTVSMIEIVTRLDHATIGISGLPAVYWHVVFVRPTREIDP